MWQSRKGRLGGRRTLDEHWAYPRPRGDFCRPRAGDIHRLDALSKETRRRGLGFLVYASGAGRGQRPDMSSCRPPFPDPQPANFLPRPWLPALTNEAKQDNPNGGIEVWIRQSRQAAARWPSLMHAGASMECLQTQRCSRAGLLPPLSGSLEHFPHHDDLPDRRGVAEHRRQRRVRCLRVRRCRDPFFVEHQRHLMGEVVGKCFIDMPRDIGVAGWWS
jgi:hypothetical protein